MMEVLAIIPTDAPDGKFYILCRSESFTHNKQAIDNILHSWKEAIKQRGPRTDAIANTKLYPSLNVASRNSGYVNQRAEELSN